MGKRKQFSWLTLALVLSIFGPATKAQAFNTEDLFNTYEVPYECSISQESLSTISAYENAKSYVARFSNLLSLEPDFTTVAARVSVLEGSCRDLEESLDSGYFLAYEEIVSLENKYSDMCEQLKRVEQTLEYESVVLQLSIPEVPTNSAYNSAIAEKENYVKQNYLGEDSFVAPVNSYNFVSCAEDKSVVYTGTWGESVYSMYNARCVDIQETDCGLLLLLEVGDSAVLTYEGILQSKIQIGDYIKQGDLIGLADDSLSVQLVLDDIPVDFRKKG